MPVYEYDCRECGDPFEALIRKAETPRCPSCGSEDLERRISLPAVKSDTTRDRSMRAAKKRDRALGRERMMQRLEYENSHDRHG